MINRAILTGRLTKAPEIRMTNSGKKVVSFTLAVNRNFKNANGDIEADFVNCVLWGEATESFVTYLQKGSLIGIDGRIQTRNYEDNDGKRVYITEIVVENFSFLEKKSASNNSEYNNSGYNNSVYDNLTKNGIDVSDNNNFNFSDNDLPF